MSRTATLLLVVLTGASGCAPLATGPARGPAPSLAVVLDSAFADTAFAHAHWGVELRTLAGETLYERNGERVFTPASNMKLITGAAVLEGLGPDFRYRTDFAVAGPVQDGVLRGHLVVHGSGDPTLSSRFSEDPRQVFRDWADSLRARGITRIEGSIIGVDSAIADPSIGAGWAWDDLQAYYAAEFGALQFNEGIVDVRVFPARAVGQPAVVVLDPPTQYAPVRSSALTVEPGAPTRIRIDREPIGPGLVVAGEIAADTSAVGRTIAVRDPALFFLTVLRETLRASGIAVEGPALNADEVPLEDPSVRGATLLFSHHSPPMSEILPAMMKPSQNWIAETMLRTVGRHLRGEGTARAGEAVVDSLFLIWGLDPDELRMADGSGLSRYSLVSPDLLADLLAHMDASPHRELWHASLPVGGVDGTLRSRMREPPLVGNVHAKTGTLSGVRALSGYLTTTTGERLVFSVLVNHHMRSAAAVDRVVDAALARIAAGR